MNTDLDAARIGIGVGQTIELAGGGWAGGYQRRVAGFAHPRRLWIQNGAAEPEEEVADMFLGWSYRNFDSDEAGAGAARNSWMSGNMRGWVALAVSRD